MIEYERKLTTQEGKSFYWVKPEKPKRKPILESDSESMDVLQKKRKVWLYLIVYLFEYDKARIFNLDYQDFIKFQNLMS